MKILYHACTGMSLGIIVGFFLGGYLKFAARKSTYSESKAEANKRLLRKIAGISKYVTFLFLMLGFIWCCYFLLLGIAEPEQADYASSMTELIVAVLTVISIIFAFLEFLKRPNS